MATIGTFTKTNDGFTGTIQTVGLKAKVAITPVEKRGENARRIEARGAKPVDRSVPGDQGGGLKVADESVVGNLRVLCAHHAA